MAKYKYVGDPAGGACAAGQITLRDDLATITFSVGVPTEVPKSFERYVAKNSHFELVAEVVPVVEVSNDGGETFAEVTPIKRRGRRAA